METRPTSDHPNAADLNVPDSISFRRLNVPSAINVLAGLWLAASAFILGRGFRAGTLNLVLVGVAIAIVGAVRVARGRRWATLSWLNAVLGGWTIASLYVFKLYDTGAVAWNAMYVAALVIVLACLAETSPEAWDSPDPDYHPAPGWDYEFDAPSTNASERVTHYTPSDYGQGGLGDPEDSR